MQEIWKDIKGYEGHYQISNKARVRSLDRLIERKGNKNVQQHWMFRKSMIRKQTINGHGYPCVMLTLNKKAKFERVHRLLMTAFVPNPKNYSDVNHKNGVRHDNRLENLEWCTRSENIKHSFDILGRYSVRGEECGKTKLTTKNVEEIIVLNKLGESQRVIARKFNTSRRNVRSIIANKSWKHISRNQKTEI